MRTVQPSAILRSVAAKAGFDLTDNTLGALQKPTVLPWLDNLAMRLRECFEMFPWPDLCLTEERYFGSGLWSAGTYASGSIVYYSGAYYQSNTSTTGTPGSSADWDELTTNFARQIPYEQLNQTVIGTVYEVSKYDPRIYAGQAGCRLRFTIVDGNGIYVTDSDASATVWIFFRQQCPDFTVHDTTADYIKGDGVFDTSGNFYVAAQDVSAGTVLSNTAYWTPYYFPWIFRTYLVNKVYADWLRTNEKTEQAAIASNQAEKAIDREIEKIVQQSGQLPDVLFHVPPSVIR